MQRTAIFLAYFFICTAIAAQKYPFVHYTPKDGLVNSRVKKTYQDSKGRMYFLTYGGLSVFDGARFKNYTTQNGLATNVVNDVLEVGDDSLLVATNNEYYLNVLVKGKIATLKTEGDSCKYINQFYRHTNGKIYISSDYGLFAMENKKIRELDISLLSKNSTELPYLGNITGSGNYLVLATNEMKSLKGLFLYDIINNRICDALYDANGLLVGKDKSNRIWILSHKLFVLDIAALSKGKILPVTPSGSYQIVKDYSTVNVAFDKKTMWLVYRDENFKNKEIHRIDESGSISRIPLPEQAVTAVIKNIMIDRENTIWLSNDGEGIFKMVNSPLLIFEKPFNSQRQIDRAFYSNNVTWFNSYWFGNNSNSLFKSSQNGVEELNSNLGKAPIIFYADNKTLLAHDNLNIYKADPNHQKKTVEFFPIFSISEPDYFGMHLIVDPNGNYITHRRSGLSVWKKNQLVFHIPIHKNDNIEGLCLDKNNLLWVVKRYSGIETYSLHPENMSTYLQLALRFTKEQLIGSPRCFLMDKLGMLWIGTRDDGLIGYKHEGNSLNKKHHFYSGNGLTDNFVTSLACDSSNNIIIGTQTGLDRIIREEENNYRIENLSKGNNFFAYIKQTWSDAIGQAFALTTSGILLQLSAPLPGKTNDAPLLFLEEMKVNAKTVSTGKQNFRYKENNISFLVAAPSFIDEKQVTYSYLLEGSGNKEWSDTTPTNAVINLTNLSAGEYLLNVKAFFPSNSYAPAELSYLFEIIPPWWQTWWFRSATGLLIIGLLIIGSRFYYRRKLEKQMAILEKQQAIEKERTRIATDMHDDLGAGLSRIKFLSQSILNKKSDEVIKGELEKITSFSDEMSEKMGEIIWALNEKNDTLADLIAYTRSYAAEYLSNHDIECEAQTPPHLPDNFITGEMRRNIFLSVKECLHNVVKHSGATKVYFSVKLNDAVQIAIHDNGKGIDWNQQRAFSNGIQNIEKRMEEINAKVHFTNEQGTKVLLTIPMIL